jgi:hypothetical protein
METENRMNLQETLRTQALLLETVQEQKKLLEHAHHAQETYRQENAALRQLLTQMTATLQQSAQHLESGGQRFAEEAMRGIDANSRQVLKENSVEVVTQVQQRTAESIQALTRAAEVAGEQARQLNRAQTTLAWKSLAFLAVGGLLLMGGTSTWAWNKKQEAERYQVDAELGRQISQSDLVRCGDGLCVNVDLKAQRSGDRKQYLPVRSR